jgi:L-threonylcarbamoyladenylate synthase
VPHYSVIDWRLEAPRADDLRILAVNPAAPRDDKLADAIGVLAGGGVVALPTETVYGLAVDASNPAALRRVNRLKGKDGHSPILLLIADRAQAQQVTDVLPPSFDPLVERFWPGPLTLVVRASRDVPAEITAGGDTVAMRVPGLALPRRLAAGLGRPISGISANLTGQPPCRTAGEVARAFPEGLAMILDGGPTPGGVSSTILDLCGTPPQVRREGVLRLAALRPFL